MMLRMVVEASEHVLARTGGAGKVLFLAFSLALVVFAFFCITFTVQLRCDHADRDLYCSSRSRSILHDSEETIAALDVQEVKAEVGAYGARRGWPKTSLNVYAVTASESVYVPVANGPLTFPEVHRELARELDAFVKGPDAAPYTRLVEGEPILLTMIRCSMLFFPLALWLAARNTLVAVDRHAGTVTISRRLLRFSTSRVVVPLARAVTIMGKPKRRGQNLFLQLTQGKPLLIEWVPHRRAVADFAALKRLFPIGGGISRE
jgi:hypothetical protein